MFPGLLTIILSPPQIKWDDRVLATEQGLLIRSLQPRDSGIFYCHAVEHGFMQTLLRLTLQVIAADHLDELLHRDNDPALVPQGDNPGGNSGANPLGSSPNQKVWYRDFLSLINHPNLNSVDDFCEQVWKRERKQRRQKAQMLQASQQHASKWKMLQDNKKGRNRRTHEQQRAPRSV